MAAIIKRNYQDHSISYNDAGWFNATEAAAKFDKEPTAWLRQSDTMSYVAALCKSKGNSGFVTEFNRIKGLDSTKSSTRTKLLQLVKATGFVKTKAGAPENGGGTWLHPKLAVAFARWLDVDFAIWCDEQIDNIVRGKDDWKHSRHIAAASYQALSTILQDVRAQDGKETLPHHYANEARLVNWALTGAFLPIDRTTLSKPDLDLLGHLEIKDISMVARGVPYEQRKAALKLHADDWRSKRAQREQLAA